MLPLEHSAILLTCIKQQLVLKTNFGVLFKWPFKTGFTVYQYRKYKKMVLYDAERVFHLVSQVISLLD